LGVSGRIEHRLQNSAMIFSPLLVGPTDKF
jgi:hypothetical protein